MGDDSRDGWAWSLIEILLHTSTTSEGRSNSRSGPARHISVVLDV